MLCTNLFICANRYISICLRYEIKGRTRGGGGGGGGGGGFSEKIRNVQVV